VRFLGLLQALQDRGLVSIVSTSSEAYRTGRVEFKVTKEGAVA